MEITYLKLMKATPKIDYPLNDNKIVNKGSLLAEIETLEQKINKQFPKAYKEFLFLGGHGSNMIVGMDHQITSLEEIQEDVRLGLEEENFKIEREFWAFGELDMGEQFHFFFFDEGNDPPVYIYTAYHIKGNPGFTKFRNSFSEYIDRLIRHRKEIGGY